MEGIQISIYVLLSCWARAFINREGPEAEHDKNKIFTLISNNRYKCKLWFYFITWRQKNDYIICFMQ
jgi:hypothetical protein